MAQRRMTIKRVDPWSVLKFGFLVNLTGLLVLLLATVVAWYFVRRLEIIETFCGLAGEVGIEECGVNGPALFRVVATLGVLGAVILTGIFVFLAFLANLISDLTGGIELNLSDDTPTARTVTSQQQVEVPVDSGPSLLRRLAAMGSELFSGGTGASASAGGSGRPGSATARPRETAGAGARTGSSTPRTASVSPSEGRPGRQSTRRDPRASTWPGDRLFTSGGNRAVDTTEPLFDRDGGSGNGSSPES